MGANNFETEEQGQTVNEAFLRARDHATYMYGHGGYTGTIAEKSEWLVIDLPEGVSIDEAIRFIYCVEYNEKAVPEAHRRWARRWADRVLDKWGPCGAIKSGDNQWTFFGFASS